MWSGISNLESGGWKQWLDLARHGHRELSRDSRDLYADLLGERRIKWLYWWKLSRAGKRVHDHQRRKRMRGGESNDQRSAGGWVAGYGNLRMQRRCLEHSHLHQYWVAVRDSADGDDRHRNRKPYP